MNIKNELNELIALCEENREKTYLFLVCSQNKDESISGNLLDEEISDIEYGFMHISNKYAFFNNASSFLIAVNDIKRKNKYTILFYSTMQIGHDINRRLVIPSMGIYKKINSLTCSPYFLGITQNKAHFYELLSNTVNIPKTYIYDITSLEDIDYNLSKRWIIKPSLECAGKGIKVFSKDNSEEIEKEVNILHKELNQKIIIQELIDGKEIEVSVVRKGDKYIVLPAIEIIKHDENKDGILDQHAIDLEKYDFSLFETTKEINEKIITNTVKCANKLSIDDGICRFDYIVCNGELYLFDIAAIPLISEHSSTFFVFNELFPEDEFAIYKCLVGSKLFSLTNN